MALMPITHKPITAQARQFDGTLESLLDILNVRPKNGAVAGLTFDGEGDFTRLDLSADGGAMSLNLGDWAIFPSDPDDAPYSLTNDQALALWQG